MMNPAYDVSHIHDVSHAQVLFRPGDAPDEVYVIESGSVLCHIDYSVISPVARRLAEAAAPDDDHIKRQARYLAVVAQVLLLRLPLLNELCLSRAGWQRQQPPTTITSSGRPGADTTHLGLQAVAIRD